MQTNLKTTKYQLTYPTTHSPDAYWLCELAKKIQKKTCFISSDPFLSLFLYPFCWSLELICEACMEITGSAGHWIIRVLFFFLKNIIRELLASEGKLRWAPAGGWSTANCGKSRQNVIYHISTNNILLFYDHFLILLLLLEKN